MREVIIEILGTVEIMAMMYGIFAVSIKKEKKWLLSGLVLLMAVCILRATPWSDTMVASTICIFFSPIIVVLWLKERLVRKIAIYICSLAYTGLPYFCINVIAMWLLKMSIAKLTKLFGYCIIRSILTIALIVIISIVLKKTEYKEMVKSMPTKYFVIGSICAFSGSLLYNFVQDITDLYGELTVANLVTNAIFIVIIVFYALGIGIAIMSSLKTRYQIESNIKDEYLRTTREYVRLVRKNARETRKLRHDMGAHISALDYYLEREQYEKAKGYLGQLKQRQTQAIRRIVSVNHELVDAILAEVQYQSEADGIRWEVEGMFPIELKLPDFDLCTIFSNVLNNSVEACRRLLEEQRYIQLSIRQLNHQLLVEVCNPVEQLVEIEKLGTITSKKDKENHGYGIDNIQDMVKQNGGELLFENEKGKFITRIIFTL